MECLHIRIKLFFMEFFSWNKLQFFELYYNFIHKLEYQMKLLSMKST